MVELVDFVLCYFTILMCCVVLTHTGLLVLYFASASPRAFAHANPSSWDDRLSSLLFSYLIHLHPLDLSLIITSSKRTTPPHYMVKHHVPLL